MNLMQVTEKAPTGGVIAQGPPTVRVTVTGADGKAQTLQVPATREQMAELVARRKQLSDELDNVSDRRNDLIERVRTAPNAAEAGLTEQLKVVNNRVVQLETDLATIGRQIAAASPDLTSTTEEPPPQNVGDLANGAGAGALATFAVMMIVLFSLRRRWRRRSGSPPAALPDDSGHRLMRLEQGMDAIAVEIERISEGQRFVTRLLSESHGGAPAAQRGGEPTTVSARDQNR